MTVLNFLSGDMRAVAAMVVVAIATCVGVSKADDAQHEFFERRIRPMLVEHCYSCHSAKAEGIKAGLNVDSRDGLLEGGDSGPAVVPGHSDQSLIMQALRHDGLEMPPAGKLPDDVIADFASWIDAGAVDPRKADNKAAKPRIDMAKARQFWSFVPPRRIEPPSVANPAWPISPIDRFTLSAMESRGLVPVAPAGKRELIRRATFDLIGLPPTPDEIDAFVADDTPRAFEKVIDRLLASPHYGERWARYWLDIARYAEDQAHSADQKPNTSGYRYRDWVIDAFNANLPFDHFVRLQIAADLMPLSAEERLRHMPALGFFGLGAQYYKLTNRAKAEADELDDRVDTLARGFLGLTVACARCHDHKYDPIPQQDYYSLAGVFHSSRLHDAPLAPPDVVAAYDEAQKRIKERDDAARRFVDEQMPQIREARVVEVPRFMAAVWKLRQGMLRKPSMTVAEVAAAERLDEKTLNRFAAFLDPREKDKVPALGAWFELLATQSVDSDAGDAGHVPPAVWAVADGFRRHLEGLLEARSATGGQIASGATSTASGPGAELLHAFFGRNGLLDVDAAEAERRLPPAMQDEVKARRAELDALKQASPPMYPVTHAIAEGSPANMRVFLRGNPAIAGDEAPRRFLRILSVDEPPAFQRGSGRLELAEAISAPTNPLTARVMVNRIWQHHFGRGLVATPDNFGQLGEPPTHPELLDELAIRFVASGWSIKSLHREIMLSATYRLGGQPHPANEASDPDNRFLWRMPRRRLDVEAWRDAVLAVSGRLDRRLHGPSVDLAHPANNRRTIYARISRHELDAVLRLFDFPDANISSAVRSETTIPQQQLFTLNSRFMVEQARAFATRLHAERPESEAARLDHAFRLAFGRPIQPDELALALEYLGGNDGPDGSPPSSLTRWQRYAQALLASNEFMYLD
ncbi:DUF1553 domain-containing protein [bacterium]|nr:DUF1553 domain-containing protein [bacterium]